jgi:hypothetical protein
MNSLQNFQQNPNMFVFSVDVEDLDRQIMVDKLNKDWLPYANFNMASIMECRSMPFDGGTEVQEKVHIEL